MKGEPETLMKAPSKKVVFIGDTSYWMRLSHDNVWAVQERLKVNEAAHEEGDVIFLTPQSVFSEYESQANNSRTDDWGNPFWHKSLESMLGTFTGKSIAGTQSSEQAAKLWRRSRQGRRSSQFERMLQSTPGNADHDVRALALAAATIPGARIFIASYDIKDVIQPLEEEVTRIQHKGIDVTLLRPEPLQESYFRNAGIRFAGLITGEAISQLRAVGLTTSYIDYLIFETGIRGGDMTFKAGVGVARKDFFRPFELPEQFSSIAGKYAKIPVVHIPSLEEVKSPENSRARRKLLNKFREFNALSLVVVDDSKPCFPFLIGSSITGLEVSPFLRADLNYLFWQADSSYAKSNYKSVSQRQTY